MKLSEIKPRTSRPITTPLLVPTPPLNPLLPPLRSKDGQRKTLILDLDETLVHSSFIPNVKAIFRIRIKADDKTSLLYVLFRPHAREFLKKVAQLFEVVIFTASQKNYADFIIDKLDIDNCVSHRLYRDHCVSIKKRYVKNLSLIGRDLKNVIIVDNSPFAYKLNVENGIPIETWTGKEDDKNLEKLYELLERLVKVEDVRQYLGGYRTIYDYQRIITRIDQRHNHKFKVDKSIQHDITINNYYPLRENRVLKKSPVLKVNLSAHNPIIKKEVRNPLSIKQPILIKYDKKESSIFYKVRGSVASNKENNPNCQKTNTRNLKTSFDRPVNKTYMASNSSKKPKLMILIPKSVPGGYMPKTTKSQRTKMLSNTPRYI
jgi:Dullard-like phosphatase family protein